MDRRLLILALGMFAMGTDNFVVAGIMPGVAASLHTTVSLAGQMVTVYALTYALLAPLLAAAAGGLPRKPLLVAALAIFVLGNAITAAATDLNTVLLSRALAGVGAALFAPTALGVAALLATPENRGRALATVTAGLAGATALGAPLGTLIGGLGSWRTTLWCVSLLGLIAMLGVWTLLPAIAQPARIALRARLAPLADSRVALTLLTSLFAFGGFLMVYTYAGAVLGRATGGDGRVLAGLLLVWGVSATAGNFMAGRLVDRYDSRTIINAGLAIGAIDFLLLPWSSGHLPSALLALVVWGLVGWGLIVPQQHRLVKLASQASQAPLLMALNNTATYTGLACSGLVGGVVLTTVAPRYLSLAGALLILLALGMAERAHSVARSRAAL